MNGGDALVKKVVRWMARSKLLLNRADVDMNDYLQIGHVAYLNALQTFDAAKGDFNPYAWKRIYGAIIDWNRKIGGRHLRPHITSVEDMVYEIVDMRSPNAEQMLVSKSDREWLLQLMEQMREAHRHVLHRYYFEDRTMRQIGEEVGLTESRISQIHDAALQSLKGMLKHPRRWKQEMESAKRRLFDHLANSQGGEIAAMTLVAATGIKDNTVNTYLNEFVNAAPQYIVKSMHDGIAYYRYIEPMDGGPDYVYGMITSANRVPKKERVRKKKEPTAANLAQFAFAPPEQKPEPAPVKKDVLGDIVKKKMAEVSTSPNVELVVKLRIQIQVEQI